jgi:hypothetical protein
MEEKQNNMSFLNLIGSINYTVMMLLGKIANPMTGTTERDLEQAKLNIDILIMLKDKTKNNLTNDEEKLLIEILTNLELNYSAEANTDGNLKN